MRSTSNILLVAVVAVLASTASCQSLLPKSAWEATDVPMMFDKFRKAIEVAGLQATLANPAWAGTVFAPTDMGFDAWLKRANLSWETFIADNSTLPTLMAYHIAPDTAYFPLNNMKDGTKIKTVLPEKALTVSRMTPGVTHVVGGAPTNFATILQYQLVTGGKTVVYVIDTLLMPPQ